MKQTIENRTHFGISIFEAEVPYVLENREKLADYFLSMREKTDDKMYRSNHGGWHSGDNLHQDKDPLIQGLMQAIYQYGTTCIRHVESAYYQGEILLSSSWVNINEAGDWNAPHMHLPCEWAGVVYIQTSEEPEQRGGNCNDGDILFFDPQPFGPQYRRSPTHPYTPKNGTMFIFPGYLLHMVAPHFEKEPRISVAFNFRLAEHLNQIGR